MAITKLNPTFGKLTSRIHTTVYKVTGGRLGGRIGKAQALLLATTGRKSGQRRETPLFGVEHQTGWAVIASNSGHDKAPDWYHNLMASPEATVQTGRRVTPVVARVVEGNERQEVWDRLLMAYKDYAAYQEVTDRILPVIALEPTNG